MGNFIGAFTQHLNLRWHFALQLFMSRLLPGTLIRLVNQFMITDQVPPPPPPPPPPSHLHRQCLRLLERAFYFLFVHLSIWGHHIQLPGRGMQYSTGAQGSEKKLSVSLFFLTTRFPHLRSKGNQYINQCLRHTCDTCMTWEYIMLVQLQMGGGGDLERKELLIGPWGAPGGDG